RSRGPSPPSRTSTYSARRPGADAMDAGLIHRFADPLPLDDLRARRWLGGKGASVALMTRMGLPVPPGFTLSTEVWRRFDREGTLAPDILELLRSEVAHIEAST